MSISEEIIQKIKDGNDIVDVVSESVKLKRSGSSFTGLCPFHNEKTPSFVVSQEKQIYKCFGCGEAGNVISFVMKNKNVTFVDAVKILGDRAHIDIAFDDNKSNKQKDFNEKLFKLNVEAARYFFSNLKNNKKAAAYFYNRGISEGTIRKFGLGYSEDSWNSLMNYLKRKGYSELDLLNAGLIVKSQRESYYDRFRNRVIFPVFDYRGRVIGFGGRVLDDSKPKYLNSPETAVFKKGTNLYGLNFAVKNITDRTIIIVEGYMDCISLHQYGINNAVASLGTALTPSQAKLLKRYADKIIISYDADLAGQMATVRGLEILKEEGFDIRVLTVPKGKDPDEFIRSNGREAFLRLIEEALPLIDYRINKIKEGLDLTNPEMLISYAKNAAELVFNLNPLEKDVYIKRISEETGIKEQSIYDLISGEIQKNVNKSQNVNIVDNFGQKLYLEPAYIKAERNILRLMLENMEIMEYITESISSEEFVLDTHRRIYSLIVENSIYEKDKIRPIEAKCSDVEILKEWANILASEVIYNGEAYKQLVKDYTREISKYKLEEQKKHIITLIKQYETKGMIEESLKLAQELVKIQKDMGRL